MSCLTFETHKSKLVVAKWHSIKVGKTYNFLFLFPHNLGNNLLEFIFMETKKNLGHKCILNLFNQLNSTNCKRRWFLTIKKLKFYRNFVMLHIIFLKRFFSSKEITYEVIRNVWSFYGKFFFILLQRPIDFVFKPFFKY
jgi:hypothetical protein